MEKSWNLKNIVPGDESTGFVGGTGGGPDTCVVDWFGGFDVGVDACCCCGCGCCCCGCGCCCDWVCTGALIFSF